MSQKSERVVKSGDHILLSDENKISHGIQYLHEINSGLDARRCRRIADGTEPFPPNVNNLANPRSWPDQPVAPVLLPGTNAGERDQNKALMDEYRSERQFWQYLMTNLKQDRNSWDLRHADGFGYLLSCLSMGLQIDLRIAIDHNSLTELYGEVVQLIGKRNDAELTKLEKDYHRLTQQEGQSLRDYLRLRTEVEATLAVAGRAVPAASARSNFLNTVLSCYNHTIATIVATVPPPDMDRIMTLLTEQETKNAERLAISMEETKSQQRIAALEAENRALAAKLKGSIGLRESSILAITEAISKAPSDVNNASSVKTVTMKTSGTGKVPCPKCGKNGHNALDCYMDVQCPHCKRFGHPGNKCFNVVACQLCGKTGHPRQKCPEKQTGSASLVTEATDGNEQFGFFD